MGLELQLVELVEQRERATVQHRPRDAADIEREIDALQEEMARTAEVIARPDGFEAGTGGSGSNSTVLRVAGRAAHPPR